MYWSPVFIPGVNWGSKHLLDKERPAQISDAQNPIPLLVDIGRKEALQWMPVEGSGLDIWIIDLQICHIHEPK